MRKGLLAEWRRGIVWRGLAAALLLAVPVGVAAMIGFETSLTGLSHGFSTLSSGPDSSQEPSEEGGSEAIDSAISAIAAPPGGGSQGGGAPGGGAPGGSAPGGGVPGAGDTEGGGGGSPGAGGGSPSAGGDAGGGSSSVVDPPEVDLPPGSPVTDLLNGVGDTLNGLLGGGR